MWYFMFNNRHKIKTKTPTNIVKKQLEFCLINEYMYYDITRRPISTFNLVIIYLRREETTLVMTFVHNT